MVQGKIAIVKDVLRLASIVILALVTSAALFMAGLILFQLMIPVIPRICLFYLPVVATMVGAFWLGKKLKMFRRVLGYVLAFEMAIILISIALGALFLAMR